LQINAPVMVFVNRAKSLFARHRDKP